MESQPGRGTTFSIEVPAAPVAFRAAAPVEKAAPSPAAGVSGLHVLCIDNEPAILDGMRALLEGWGCIVTTAPDERVATRQIKADGRWPDALIADFHLDKGDGLTAIRSLRKALSPDLKAILLTADRTAEIRDKAAAMDVVVFNKPAKPAALRAWLSQASLRRAAAE